LPGLIEELITPLAQVPAFGVIEIKKPRMFAIRCSRSADRGDFCRGALNISSWREGTNRENAIDSSVAHALVGADNLRVACQP
jgi:hypothetical protein